ncbi:type VI secretion system membrane subunit TssM [Agaribacterium haliotis]|uniref:type VI secretion system membrane subunit TssM n=1 Tax=Agaribacterium haliotis TaxID=2013869 RepID=UPI000BB57630|nr:type VI secretion system membrane subunit TssM [Agaribacterium haliotis]
MKSIRNFFFHPLTLSAIGLLLLSLLIWFAGPQIKFGADNSAPLASPVLRLAMIAVLILLWALNNMRLQLKNAKNNKAMIADMAKSESEAKKGGAKSEEYLKLSERFSEAMQVLKARRFGSGSGKKSLYELPWYIIVGPPGAGKTTALVHSGLEFPLADSVGKQALQGIGGTRNCDWWFTNEAVLIDTAGRYTTQDSHKVADSQAWDGFLSLLKKYRPRRPINGAIVAISLQELMLQSEQERKQQANVIRTRLNELMDKLELEFPVYVLLTKVDLVPGFKQFFDDLSRDDRHQVWGLTLPFNERSAHKPDFDYLSDNLAALVDRLNQKLFLRMNQERDPARRSALSAFPEQLDLQRPLIDDFIRSCFAENNYKKQPVLRGMYFTSGTQDGSPIDRIMASVSSEFGFAQSASERASGQGKSYFLTDLFSKVIFPEAELAGTNRRYETIIAWARRGVFALSASAALGAVLLWSGMLADQKIRLGNTAEQLTAFDQAEKQIPARNASLLQVLPALNALVDVVDGERAAHKPWFEALGMQDSRIADEAQLAYQRKLDEVFRPALQQDLAQRTRRGDGDLYSDFKLYMMFDLIDHWDGNAVTQGMTARWDNDSELSPKQRLQLQNHLAALLELPLRALPANRALVRSTRNKILATPVAQRIYRQIKNNPTNQRRVELDQYLGAQNLANFKLDALKRGALSIPILYTIDGYNALDLDDDSQLVAEAANDGWLLYEDENKARAQIAREINPEKLSDEVRSLYFRDYIQYWLAYYKAFELQSFTSLGQAENALAMFADPIESPLIAMMSIAKDNTSLTKIPSSDKLEQAAEASGRSYFSGALKAGANKIPTTKVDKRFADLNKMLKANAQGMTQLDVLIQKLAELHVYVQEIAVDPDPAKKSFSLVKGRYESGGSNAMSALRDYSRRAPAELRPLLSSLADQSWKVVVASARAHVNDQWQEQVYQPYSLSLQGRYPLKKDTDSELALYDFSEFFKPGGSLDTFSQSYVYPFVRTGKKWSNKALDGYSLGFSASTLAQLKRADQIRQVFFRGEAEQPSFSLELKPSKLSADIAKFTLDVASQRYSYNHGPKFWKPLNWAADSGNGRVRLVFEDLDERNHDRSYTGPWAWFRLMDDSRIEKTAQSNIYRITFSLDQDEAGATYQITYQGRAKSVNNPFNKDLLSSFRCPATI